MPATNQFGQVLSGALANKAVHTYALSANSAGVVTFNFKHPNGIETDGERIKIVLLDSLENVVQEKILTQNATWSTTIAGAGEYTVRVVDQDQYRDIGGTYALTPTLQAVAAVYDGAANNSAAAAIKATIGKAIIGSLNSQDADFFQIDVGAGGTLSFDFDHSFGDKPPTSITVDVLDAAGNIVTNQRTDGIGHFATTVAAAGSYTIKVYDGNSVVYDDGGIYSLLPKFDSKLDTTYDGGANNTSNTAILAPLSRAIVGGLDLKDTDFFRFSAKDSGQLHLNFMHPDGIGMSGSINISVINAATGTTILQKPATGSDMFTAALDGGGDYLIKINDSGYSPYANRGVYSLLASATNAKGDDLVQGTGANDRFESTSGNDTYMGEGGFDTVLYNGKLADYRVAFADAGLVIDSTASAEGKDVLYNISRLQFSDKTIDIGQSSQAAQLFRLYDTVFNRAPDEAGVGFWLSAMEQGYSLNAVAHAFTASAEYRALYGTAASRAELVTRFYQNALDRAPDDAGLAYWVAAMDRGADAADILIGFSESAEHQAMLVGQIDQGVTYLPFHA